MDAKDEFLKSLHDEQLGFFYAHEYDCNLEDKLQDQLNIVQFNLFNRWKEEEALLNVNSPNDSQMNKLINIEALLEKLASSQNLMEEKNDNVSGQDGGSTRQVMDKLAEFEVLLRTVTSRLDKMEEKLENTAVQNDGQKIFVTGKLNEHELLMKNLATRLEKLHTTYSQENEGFKTSILEKVKTRFDKMEEKSEQVASAGTINRSELYTLESKIRAAIAKVEPAVPLDAPTIDNSMNDGGSIFCVGGLDASYKPTRGVQAYDSKINKWISLGEMNEIRNSPGLVGANGKLYAIGGHDGVILGECLDSAEVFDSSSRTWSSIAPMNEPAFGLGVAYSNGVIYAIGGEGSSRRLNKAEKYDIKLDTWTELPSMTAKRSFLGCAVLDGMVYAVGGYDRPNHLNSCERYNPRLNKWEAIASMEEERSGLGLCVLNEFLYAVGGYNNDKTLASVERYDTNTNKWTKVAAMASPRKDLSVAIMDGLMYAIGGQFGYKILKSVEVYSPLLDEWSPAADLNEACGGGAAAWVDCSLDGLPAANKEKKDSKNAPSEIRM